MSNYDSGEDVAAGDEFDRLDWTELRHLRRLIESVSDADERRSLVLELLRAVYGDELELR